MQWIQVFRSSDPTEGYLVRDYLMSKGIDTQLRGEHLASVMGAIPVTDSFPTLWVPEASVALARAALQSWEAEQPAGEAWKCPDCYEGNEPTFGSCWSCGAMKP